MLLLATLATLALSSIPIAASPATEERARSLTTAQVVDGQNTGCPQIFDQFPDQTFFSGSATYINESSLLWSRTCVLSPSCVFTPRSAEDIAAALSILRSTGTKFSVRGGGHMPIPGAASTSEGVLIGMTNLNSRTLTAGNSVAQIGSGQVWADVYDWISSFGLGVVGGRFGSVGVGGYLLGGGISHLSNQYGWAVSNIVNYQVVLANSTIIDVNSTSHPDLFWAIKGGSNNFGIVARFDLKTVSITNIWGGQTLFDQPYFGDFLNAVSSFYQPGGGLDDIHAGIASVIAIVPGQNLFQGSLTTFHTGPDLAPQAFSNFTKIPSLTNDVGLRTSLANFTDEFNAIAADRSSRVVFGATSMKITTQSISLINNTITSRALSQLSNVTGCSVSVSIQPITESWLTAAKESGGDALDLDPANGRFMSVMMTSQWTNAEDDAIMRNFSVQTIASLENASKEQGIYYPFIYLNDAGEGTSVYPLYGGGKSLPRMKNIRQRYDPDAVFQELEGSGFKLGI